MIFMLNEQWGRVHIESPGMPGMALCRNVRLTPERRVQGEPDALDNEMFQGKCICLACLKGDPDKLYRAKAKYYQEHPEPYRVSPEDIDTGLLQRFRQG